MPDVTRQEKRLECSGRDTPVACSGGECPQRLPHAAVAASQPSADVDRGVRGAWTRLADRRRTHQCRRRTRAARHRIAMRTRRSLCQAFGPRYGALPGGSVVPDLTAALDALCPRSCTSRGIERRSCRRSDGDAVELRGVVVHDAARLVGPNAAVCSASSCCTTATWRRSAGWSFAHISRSVFTRSVDLERDPVVLERHVDVLAEVLARHLRELAARATSSGGGRTRGPCGT